MNTPTTILFYVAGFVIIALASGRIAEFFRKIHLPLITGFLATGLLAGPYILKLIEAPAIPKLAFINDFSLAFIAFAAAAEFYLHEARDRLKSIAWNTFGQLVITFVIGSAAVYLLAQHLPFLDQQPKGTKWAVALLAGTIFVARSPSSAIAIITEMRAKGPFINTVLGVTLIKDLLVIILFAAIISLADNLIIGNGFNLLLVGLVILEVAAAIFLGLAMGRWLAYILQLKTYVGIKAALVLFSGYIVFPLADLLQHYTGTHMGMEIYFEPLLICMSASFWVSNYSRYRADLMNILEIIGPSIYTIFYTYTGSSLSLDVLAGIWHLALLFFGIRLLSLILGNAVGVSLAGDPKKYLLTGWMSYVTQAGVGLGLAMEIAGIYPGWGRAFATLLIAVIVINELVGPPLFKWAILLAGEAHRKAQTKSPTGNRYAVIFGLERQSLALARQLKKNQWNVRIACLEATLNENELIDVPITKIEDLSLMNLTKLGLDQADAVVGMLPEEENLELCERIYEAFGTEDVIVRLYDHSYFEKFHKLGALIVEPASAAVSLLDHFVRSPVATSLLLGMEHGQDTMDIEITNPAIHGLSLRDLRFPLDSIILSIKRGDNILISHGYTRLRRGDQVTVIGSPQSLEEIANRLSK